MRRVLARVPTLAGRLVGSRPLPLGFCEMLQWLGRGPDALAPEAKPISGATLSDPVLAAALQDVELGTWTIGPATIAVLHDLVRTRQPEVILEFGSGVSTVCLAHFAASATMPVHIVSLEQDGAEVERTRMRVSKLRAAAKTTVIHAPLEARMVEGRRVSSYTIPEGALDRVLGDRMIDLVLIDGPAAEDGARVGTLPLVRGLLSPGALVVMDDALRDGELWAARRWKERGQLSIRGVLAVGHGLLVGTAP